MNHHLFRLLLISFLILNACKKDNSFLKDSGSLNFSKDTIYFDTVFTKLPNSNYPRSINKQFMIRNPYNQSVSVNVKLNTNSVYRINVDGRSGNNIQGIEILPKDSAWVFVEASLTPNNASNPILIKDSIEFETNGNRQYVQLAAYGWDAYYFKDSVFENNTNWILTDKPYVIVNSIFVNTNATLTIGPGVHVYSTPNSTFRSGITNKLINVSAINVFGTMKVNGTKSQPVIFEGDRLDNNFNDVAGQWRGIHFYSKSINNEINYSIIKNSTIGLWVDSLPENGNNNPNLKIKNTIIKNISAYGILGLTAVIEAENTVVSNCGLNTFIGYYGGFYTFNHCTFHSNSAGRNDPHIILNNQLRNEDKVVIKTFPIGFTFLNSIIYGSQKNEIGTDLSSPTIASPAVIQNCLLKLESQLSGSTGNIYNQDPKFVDAFKNNLKLKSDSPAKDKGIATSLLTDFDGNSRVGLPDLGAFEIQ